MGFLSHTGGDGAGARHLEDHLRAVARDCAAKAQAASAGDAGFVEAARWAGLLHDLGKYSDAFQERIHALAKGDKAKPVRHAYIGAAAALEARAPDIAFAVHGHHSGLPSSARLRELDAESKWEAGRLLGFAAGEGGLVEVLRGKPPSAHLKPSDPTTDLRIRMLLSCLVDADRLDAAGEPVGGSGILDAAGMLARLQEHVRRLDETCAKGSVLDARRRVIAACLEAAEWPERLLTLTVPTGGGKTLASMAFALRRAKLRPDEVRRVIVVIPYLSIIEQNAGIYADILGRANVVEHHSGDFRRRDRKADDEQESARDLAIENWDAPVVVTTSARFFDGLFSDHPSDLRRLHNIARSVVVLDEVQTLPRHFLAPILSMVRGLADEWGTAFLFCTATQPAFEKPNDGRRDDRRWVAGTLREVMPDPAGLFRVLKRVSVAWPSPESRHSWDDLADTLARRRRALCIVNTRSHARELYGKLRERPVPEDRAGLWHLSTNMCPRHRLDVIARIRGALAEQDGPCLVVSTQLVEAGVDLDFPAVFRAIGPLDSVIQAAGRCNREGLLAEGQVIVFEPEDAAVPPGAYAEATQVTRRRALQGSTSIDDPAAVRDYFDELYGDCDQDQKAIEGLRSRLDFPEVARCFKLIDSATIGVLVPYGDGLGFVDRLRETPRLTRDLARKLQPYKVGLMPYEFEQARRNGAVTEILPGSDLWCCSDSAYSPQLGIMLAPDEGRFVV